MTTVTSLDTLPKVAKELLDFADGATFFIFNGEMGAGKTTFIKCFCELLGVRDLVSSPTFSIVNEYDRNGTPVYHFDFYRLKNNQEAYDIGYEDYFYSGDYCLVEWAEKVQDLLPPSYIEVKIVILTNETREFHFIKHF